MNNLLIYPTCLFSFLLSFSLYAQDNLILKIKTGENTKWLTFSPDGRYLATTKGKKANLWLSGTSTLTKQFKGHKRQINDLCFSSDSKYLITVSKDKTVKIWDIEANKEIKTLQGHTKAVNSVAYGKVGNFLATASNDKTVKIWDFETGSEKQSYSEHLRKVKCVAISPDGRYVASAGGDIQQTANKKILERNNRIVIIREVSTGKIIRKIAAHKKLIRTLTFSPDGKYLASGGDDKTIKIWSLEDTSESVTLSGQIHPKHTTHLHGKTDAKSKAHKGWIFDLEYSPDGKFLASASGDKSAVIWEAETGVLFMNFKKKHRNSISSLSFSPDGKYLATTEIEGKYTKLRDVSSLNIVPVYQFKDEKDNAPPQIYVSNPPNIKNNRIIISRDLIDVRGTVIDESGVRNLLINGRKVPVKKNGSFVILIPLTPGVNKVKIEAVDVNDNITARWFDVIRKDIKEEKYDAQKAVNYLFVVGINDYQYWPKLFNAVSDAKNVAGTLINMYRFDSTNTIVLLDSNATRNNIYKTLRNYIEKISPQDNLLIYYAGHGHFDDLLNEGYWIPFEADLGSDGDYLSNTSIKKILQNINSRHTFLVADACFSGSLFSESNRGYTENVEQYKSRWGLASGRLETVSDGRGGQHSPFANAFISFLKENEKEKMLVSEIVQYVKVKVAEVTKQTPIGNPLKNVGDEGGEFIFYKR
ncbi:MAG: hypothetical protein FVQ77_13810 [Cytophagales bacterium]|nr:hypothetical protein [Cytophagales bacterium]